MCALRHKVGTWFAQSHLDNVVKNQYQKSERQSPHLIMHWAPLLDAWYRQVLILATSPGSPMFCICKSISLGEVACGPSCNVNDFKKDHLIGLNNSGTNRFCWTWGHGPWWDKPTKALTSSFPLDVEDLPCTEDLLRPSKLHGTD